MAVATEHAVNPPSLVCLVLVAPELFSANGAINDLLFAEDVHAKLLHA